MAVGTRPEKLFPGRSRFPKPPLATRVGCQATGPARFANGGFSGIRPGSRRGDPPGHPPWGLVPARRNPCSGGPYGLQVIRPVWVALNVSRAFSRNGTGQTAIGSR